MSWTETSYRQLQSSTAVGEDAYTSMADCFRKIIKNEGCASGYLLICYQDIPIADQVR